MPGEFCPALAFRQIATDAGRECRAFDQERHLLIVRPLRADGFALAGIAPKLRTMPDPGQLQSGLQGDDRVSGVRRATADLDLAPAMQFVNGTFNLQGCPLQALAEGGR